jgi:hypothetical protein
MLHRILARTGLAVSEAAEDYFNTYAKSSRSTLVRRRAHKQAANR